MGILTGNTFVDIIIVVIIGIVVIMILGWLLGMGHPYWGPRMMDGIAPMLMQSPPLSL